MAQPQNLGRRQKQGYSRRRYIFLPLFSGRGHVFSAVPSSPLSLFGLAITLVEAVAYVMSGMYGDVKDIGFFIAGLIVVQLFISGIICILLVCCPM